MIKKKKEWTLEKGSLLKKGACPELELVERIIEPNESLTNPKLQRVVKVKNKGKDYILKIFYYEADMAQGHDEAKNTKTLGDMTDYVAKVVKTASGPKQFEILYQYAGTSLLDIKKAYRSIHGQPSEGATSCYFTAEQWVGIMSNLLDGFAAQEALGMVHSDIKPANMAYSYEDKKARIIDLGGTFEIPVGLDVTHTYILGKMQQDGKYVKYRDDLIKEATNEYTPPEISRDLAEKRVYSGLDVYAFAVSFYELMLTKSAKVIKFEKKTYRHWMVAKKEHDKFLAEVQKIRLLDDPDGEISSKIRELLLVCLDYEPRKRPSFAALSKMFWEMIATPGTFQENQDTLFNTPEKLHIQKDIKSEIFSESGDTISIISGLYHSLPNKGRHLINVSNYTAFLLSRKIDSDPVLMEFNLCKRTIDDVGAELVMKSLHGHANLQILNMKENKMAPRCAEFIRHVLMYCPSIRNVYLSGNALGGQGFATVMEGAFKAANLDDLRLSNNGITDAGVIKAVKSLEDPEHAGNLLCPGHVIRSIYLEKNEIGPEGAERIAKLIEGGYKGMTILSLLKNKLGYAGCKRLVEAAKGSGVRLVLHGNGYTKEQAEELTKLHSKIDF